MSFVWKGPEFDAANRAYLQKAAKRARITAAMEMRLLSLFGHKGYDGNVDATAVALVRRGWAVWRWEPVSSLFARRYYKISDEGYAQASRILYERTYAS